ncbi:MAG: protein phosphatase 2C domain-containing protein [Oscillospiraceae bacterium]
MYYCCGISDVGSLRDHNEDAFLINNIVMSHAQLESTISHPFITGVADGVASEKSGEIASKLCLELLANIKFSKATDLKKKLLGIHENLRSYGINHDNALNMQTTLCALAVDEDNVAYSINIGDSRMYRLHEGKLKQITKDQSLVQLMYEAGEITKEEKDSHSKKHIIFPVVGNLATVPCPDIKKIGEIPSGDMIFICTDGLSDYVKKERIQEILLTPELSLNKKLSFLVHLANENGGNDNITAVAVFAETVNE